MDAETLRAKLHQAIDRDWPEIAASPLCVGGWAGVIQIHVGPDARSVTTSWSVGRAIPRALPDHDEAA